MDWKDKIPERYRIFYDRVSGSFKILDTWHESVMNLPDLTGEIPDDSQAVKILNTLEVNALVGELGRMGWLNKFLPEKSEAQGINIANIAPSPKSKTVQEIAIEKIADIVKSTSNSVGADEAVSKEGISAIRDLVKSV